MKNAYGDRSMNVDDIIELMKVEGYCQSAIDIVKRSPMFRLLQEGK